MKRFIVFILMLSFSSLVYGQVSFGLTGGLNFSNYSDAKSAAQSVDVSGKTGVAAGFFAEIGAMGLSVAPEVLFVQKGSNFDTPLGKLEYNFNYIEIPVLVRYYLPVPIVKPFLTFGPYFASTLSAKVKIAGDETDIKDNISTGDTGIKLGVGVKLKKLFIQARYSIGLKEIEDKSNASATSKFKNKTMELRVGISL